MTFDPNTFPVANTEANRIRFAVGNVAAPPETAATCLLKKGRVKAALVKKHMILVTLEEIEDA